MNAKEMMTRTVVTITPDTMLADAAALLAEHRISGLPVVERDRVVGMVSESDLLKHREMGERSVQRPWWACMFRELPDPLDYVKAHGVRARDVMTMPVISVGEDAPAPRIAALLEKRGIRRVPVVRGERLVGIVTRADLVRSMGLAASQSRLKSWQSDESIRARLLEELDGQAWWNTTSNVQVTRGVVVFSGVYDSEDAKRASRVAAENIAGVRRVEDNRVDGGRLLSMMG